MYYKKIFQSIQAVLLTVSLMAAPAWASKTSNLDLFVGEVHSLGSVAVNRVAVGSGKVVRVEAVSGGELLIIAEGKGSSSLKLWLKNGSQQNYNIRVSEHDPEQRVTMQDMIRIKVKMIEFRKTATTDLGIKWLDSINGPAVATIGDFNSNSLFRPAASGINIDGNLPLEVNKFTSYFGITTGITSKINLLANRGDAVTIAEPVLTVVNGGSAKFLSGGEIPYSTVSSNGQVNVEFKEYGIKLDIIPRASRDGNIYTEIKSELSRPDPGLMVDGIPALLSRKTESQMNVISGQTIVLAGLLSANTSKTKDGLPWISNIPYIGSLFGSTNYEDDITELVLFVTPEIVTPADLGGNTRQKALQSRSDERLDKIGKKLKYSIME